MATRRPGSARPRISLTMVDLFDLDITETVNSSQSIVGPIALLLAAEKCEEAQPALHATTAMAALRAKERLSAPDLGARIDTICFVEWCACVFPKVEKIMKYEKILSTPLFLWGGQARNFFWVSLFSAELCLRYVDIVL